MIINAERMRIEEDTDNNLWLVDFRDEEKGLRGKIELPSGIVAMEDIKEFKLEILSRDKIKSSLEYNKARIVFNVINFRSKSVGNERIYSFSAGGLMLRLFSSMKIPEFRVPLKEYVLIIR